MINEIGFVFIVNYHSSLFCFTVVNTALFICVLLTIYEWLFARNYTYNKHDYYHCFFLEDYQSQFAIIYYNIWIIIIIITFLLFIVALIISHFGYRTHQKVIKSVTHVANCNDKEYDAGDRKPDELEKQNDKDCKNNKQRDSIAIIGDQIGNDCMSTHGLMGVGLPPKMQTHIQLQLSSQSTTSHS